MEDEYFFIYVQNVVEVPKYKRTEEQAKILMKDLLATVNFFHSQRLVHAHLGLEHLEQVYDFWKEIVMEENYERMQPGMPLYYTCPSKFAKICAPEIMARQKYDKRADFWSVGFVLWQFLEDPSIVKKMLSMNKERTYNWITSSEFDFTTPAW